jgi:hypothetical protein
MKNRLHMDTRRGSAWLLRAGAALPDEAADPVKPEDAAHVVALLFADFRWADPLARHSLEEVCRFVSPPGKDVRGAERRSMHERASELRQRVVAGLRGGSLSLLLARPRSTQAAAGRGSQAAGPEEAASDLDTQVRGAEVRDQEREPEDASLAGPACLNCGNTHLNMPMPMPSTGAGAATPSPAVNPDQPRRLNKMRTALLKSPAGAHAVSVLDRYNVKVKFASGAGGFYDSSTNTITLNRSWDIPTSALALVHEAHHAEASNNGTAAKAKQLSRADYIHGKLTEEATAELLACEARVQLLSLPPEQQTQDFGKQQPALYDSYEIGRQQGIDALLATNPGASPDAIARAGREGALAKLIEEYASGNVTTSTNGKSYPVLYGEYWDKAPKA